MLRASRRIGRHVQESVPGSVAYFSCLVWFSCAQFNRYEFKVPTKVVALIYFQQVRQAPDYTVFMWTHFAHAELAYALASQRPPFVSCAPLLLRRWCC